MTSSPTVRLVVDDGVATITLDRPEAGNAIDLSTAGLLADAVESARDDPRVGAILLEGGARSFCVGGDLRTMADAPDRSAYLLELAGEAHRAIRALHTAPQPVVAVVRGAAAGAGLALTLAADVVVAGGSARFVVAYPAVGLTPDCGTSWLLPRVVGLRAALTMSLTGESADAERAVQLGLASVVCADAEAAQRGRDIAARIAAGAAGALGATRRLLREGLDSDLDAHLDREARSISRAAGGPEAGALIERFLAR
ncbi:enoyl-CoA hydratase/isomerase family protein [Microbacterium sp. No. 7]|uniref:enoyl-CoA hydratase/isomerase family protein n=1 Tax=Microbacterium sp. No. 7 TaxID=1714373 RepID=UPI0006D010C7|nr:enoyl-CoA hydratase-related protein [Microbacterium sp. No. 7]ALJ21873.1 hypothetical protein AOA12_19015 [Microbacterium sp. No. 7]